MLYSKKCCKGTALYSHGILYFSDPGVTMVNRDNPEHDLEPKSDEGYFCRYCNRRFAWPQNRRRHERVHTGEKPYSCEECGKQFSDPSAFRKHCRLHGDRPFTCSVCGKGFTERAYLKRHELFHMNLTF